MKSAVEFVPGVVEMHHIHVWELDEHRRAMEAHIVIATASSMSELESLKTKVRTVLQERFHIPHCTLEMESEGAACEWNSGNAAAR